MTESSVGAVELEALRLAVRGPVLTGDDPGYDDARAVWNAMFDRRPSLIVQCTGVGDVQAGIRFAREHGLQLGVRGGGHSISGASSLDDGLLLDLRLMAHVRVDPQRRIAYAGGGTTWGLFDRETQVHGLASTGGMVSTTGVAGLTLGGGVGRFMRKHGLTCDNVLGFEVVTADGEWLRVDSEHHPDLFWALRGGGGEFAVVTEFEFTLHPLGPIVHGGYIAWRLDQTREVFGLLRDRIANAPEELQLQFILTTGPPVDFMPSELHGEPILLLAATWMGDPREGVDRLRPFVEAGSPPFAMVGDVPYAQLQTFADVLAPPGRRNYMKSGFLEDVSEDVLDGVIGLAERFPTEFSLIELYQMGGALARVEDGETAFSTREGGFFYVALGSWEDEADEADGLAWCRAVDAAMESFKLPGRYTNFVADTDEGSFREALGSETYKRLLEIKAKYDPDRVFSRDPNSRSARRAIAAAG